MYDWGDLRHFLAVARAGSLAGAARLLRVDQTTVGRRLAALEHALGAQLFDRTPQGMQLTPAGERMAEAAGLAEAQHFEVERQVWAEDRRLEGTVRISTAEGIATHLVVPLLRPLRDRLPGLRFDVATGASSVDLLRRQADLALRVGARPQQNTLQVRKIGRVRWGLYASEHYVEQHGQPRCAEDLAAHDAVSFGAERDTMPQARWARRTFDPRRVTMASNSVPAMVEACVLGYGLAPLPCMMASTRPGLVRLEAEVPGADLWFVALPRVAEIARVRAVLDFIKTESATVARLLGDAPA